MPDNKLQLEIDDSDARAKIASLKAELAQLVQQAQVLKSALSDLTGKQRGLAQGALVGVLDRMGSVQSSLGNAQSSSIIGGAAAATGAVAALGMMGSPLIAPSVGGGAGASVVGVTPINPGISQGIFGSSGFVAWRSGIVSGGGGALVAAGGFGGGGGGITGPPAPGGALVPFAAPMGGPQRIDLSGGQYVNQSGYSGWQGPYPWNRGEPFGFNRYGVRLGAAIGYAAAGGADDYLNYQTARIRTGGVDYMAQGAGIAGGIGSAAGGILGGAIGSAFGPLGALAGAGIGAGIGGTIGASFGRFIGAPFQNKADATVTMNEFFGGRFGSQNVENIRRFTEGTLGEQRGPYGAVPYTPSRMERILGAVNDRYAKTPELQSALPNVAQTFGTVAGTLFNYGIDPFGAGESGVPFRFRPFEKAAAQEHAVAMRYLGAPGTGGLVQTTGDAGYSNLINGKIHGAKSDILGIQRASSSTDETLAETYTRRLGLLFGKDSAEAAKRIGPGFDPMLGGNVADVLGKLGASDTLAYLRIQNPGLASSVDPALLSRVAGQSGANTRLGALGSLLPTGAAFASSGAHLLQMQNLATLPGGKDSLAFAQEYAGYRGDRFSAFGAQTLGGFGLRDLELQGQQQRQQYMPFAPGNIFRTSLGIIGNNMGQIRAIQGQLNLPDLSEQERYTLTSQQQGLRTENARNIGMLSEGFENRLPALAAGRPGFFGRYNSAMGAAINLGRIGSPVRAYGSGSGGQLAMQDAFLSAIGGDSVPHAGSPYSRTGEMNTPILQSMEGLLRQLVHNTTGGQATVGRPLMADRNGQVQGGVNKDIGSQQQAAWASH